MWCSQRKILGPLLLSICVIDSQHEPKTIDLYIFSDDTNLFYSHQNINSIFSTANLDLEKVGQWFKTNKLLWNI